jgi:hypothetical protein
MCSSGACRVLISLSLALSLWIVICDGEISVAYLSLAVVNIPIFVVFGVAFAALCGGLIYVAVYCYRVRRRLEFPPLVESRAGFQSFPSYLQSE